ncbi:hypothetical protein LEP1GSC062_0245 [Leptospira alexanderi serovar Manhao 3 str. L 60]|uniref:Uncharacterized protein n=1 Tax=Leptospira alexanderi serovar Manhao 3 str. L 60 TaxID=1049759 RepID=V6I593_9LEPT|nr:hypothetical protein LEP1GSC062_0245 [Leptospira alexanderi serovar Manhao 3 str. L 60]
MYHSDVKESTKKEKDLESFLTSPSHQLGFSNLVHTLIQGFVELKNPFDDRFQVAAVSNQTTLKAFKSLD